MKIKMAQLTFNCKSYATEGFTGGTIFLIAALKSKGWFYRPIVNILINRGFNVWVYDYAWRPILAAHPEEWAEVSERMARDIADKIAMERRKYPAARFGIIGASVGSALALHAAKISPEIEKIMLVTVYGSKASQIWEYPMLREIHHKLVSTGRDVRDAAAIFGYLEPVSHLELIGQRKILLYINERDPVISFSNTQLFIDEAKKHNLNLMVRRISARRHSTTILKVFKEPVLWVPFFMGLKQPQPKSILKHDFMVG